MKRVIALLLVVLMAVSLCGCSKEQSKGPEPGTALNTFYQAIMDAQPENVEELILFEEANPDLIASFYPGLDAIELNQQAYYMPPIATHPCEIVLVEVKNDADVQAAVSAGPEKLGESGRLLFREPGTGPVIRVMVEAQTLEICQECVDSVIDVICSKGHVVV